jgi:hypothetical protein
LLEFFERDVDFKKELAYLKGEFQKDEIVEV